MTSSSNDDMDTLDSNVECDEPSNGSSNQDESDANWFKGGRSRPQKEKEATMPVERNASAYNMNHKRRGKAIIFNHFNFKNSKDLPERKGTNEDKENLKKTLSGLGFEVVSYDDKTYLEVEKIIERLSMEDHSDADCLLIAVLSHGEQGILHAKDRPYNMEVLMKPFNAERCTTLAGKPKLFLIQACQGDEFDSGTVLKKGPKTQTDSSGMSYKIPSQADFLVAFSTIPGFYSWRNTTAGSWFIQAFCKVMSKDGEKEDLLQNLTSVARTVALDFQSYTPLRKISHEKKQIPCIISMLTRSVFFTPKNVEL